MVILPRGVSSISELCDDHGGGRRAVKKKRWTNVSLNHCQTLLKYTLLRKLFNQAFTCKVLASMMNIHFELGIGALLSEM